MCLNTQNGRQLHCKCAGTKRRTHSFKDFHGKPDRLASENKSMKDKEC